MSFATPFEKVPSGGGWQKVNLISYKALEAAMQEAELVFEKADDRFDDAPAANAEAQVTTGGLASGATLLSQQLCMSSGGRHVSLNPPPSSAWKVSDRYTKFHCAKSLVVGTRRGNPDKSAY